MLIVPVLVRVIPLIVGEVHEGRLFVGVDLAMSTCRRLPRVCSSIELGIGGSGERQVDRKRAVLHVSSSQINRLWVLPLFLFCSVPVIACK